MCRRRRALLGIVFVLHVVSRSYADGPTPQAPNLDAAVEQLVPRLKTLLGNAREVSVREFVGTGFSDVGVTKRLADALRQELKSSQFVPKAGVFPEIRGEIYRLPRNPEQPLVGYELEVAVLQPPAGSKVKLNIEVLNRDEAAQKVGGTGEVLAPPAKDRGQPFTRPIIRTVSADGEQSFRVAPSPLTPYAVELLREVSEGKYVSLEPTELREQQGRAERDTFEPSQGVVTYELKPGDIYAVRLFNDSGFDAVCRVSIDGVYRFELADDPEDRQSAGDLVRPKTPRTISGYFRDGATVDAFQVGEYSMSVAAQLLPHPDDVGTVTVSFAAAWEPGADRPPGEPKEDQAATVQGPKRFDGTTPVSREVGAVRAVVKLRYVSPE